jgi:hypothetical protein
MSSLATFTRMLAATVPAPWPPRAEAMRESVREANARLDQKIRSAK